MTTSERKNLQKHLQTAIEIELATIPVYLYTYYSINRVPDACDKLGEKEADKAQTFANKSGGLIMSVAVEEMLHMSLACNILKSLGGKPKIYQKSPEPFPSNLPHHKEGFEVGLNKLSTDQLEKFLEIEKPEGADAPPQGDNWDTIGQFYDYIEKCIKKCSNSDFKNPAKQLSEGDKYYASNNVDTIYPKNANYIKKKLNPNDPVKKGSSVAVYPNADDSGNLVTVIDKKSAIKAITIIKDQGEGFPASHSHEYDDKGHDEDSHWFKYHDLYKKLSKFSEDQQECFIYNFPDNPTVANYPAKYQPLARLTNAIYSYLLWITEESFNLSGAAQHTMFYIGMHKGMIFILDKIIGAMRAYSLDNGEVLAPTFENYTFLSKETAKDELVNLAISLPEDTPIGAQIIERIKNLPNVHVPPSGIVQFS